MKQFKEHRELTIQLQRSMGVITNFDIDYHFYFDETNNIKKFRIKDDEFNNNYLANFVLGGVVCESDKVSDIEKIDFFSGCKFQTNLKEVKFKHIAKGAFLDCLKSKNLQTLLSNIISSDLYIHFTSLNILYWSLVDIVDSCNITQYGKYILYLKDALYRVCLENISEVQVLLCKYNYPDISNNDLSEFIDHLQHMVKSSTQNFAGLDDVLITVLEEAKNNNALVFVQNEERYQLIKSFVSIYCVPVYMFENSKHTFDKESDMEKEITDYLGIDNSYKYVFKDSKDDPLIQVSDIIVGIIGKMKLYINSNSINIIKSDKKELNDIQLKNLRLLSSLISKTHSHNNALTCEVEPQTERVKMSLLLG